MQDCAKKGDTSIVGSTVQQSLQKNPFLFLSITVKDKMFIIETVTCAYGTAVVVLRW